MNLSKIEKTFIIILVVGAIIAGGIFLFIMPAKDKIDSANSRLDALKAEEEALNAELAREATIDDEIKTAKTSAEKLEGTFYPDLTTYEAVEIVLAHLKANNLTTHTVEATLLTTADLALEVYVEEPVIYDLKLFSQSARGTDEDALLEGQFKDGNKVYNVVADTLTSVTITDENGTVVEISKYTDTMKEAHKEALCRLAASTQAKQVVGITEVTFEAIGKYADYLKFVDFVYGLDRATHMSEVEFPMTYDPEDEEEDELLEQVEEITGKNLVVPVEDDTEVTVPMTIKFFSVEQMEELETIDASGVQIVVNQ